MIGSIVGLLALIAAVLPHWVLPVLYLAPPIDQVVVETGQRVKERLLAHKKGVEYQVPQRETSAGDRLGTGFSLAAISLGMLAIALSVFSLIFREEKLLAALSATLGIGAIAVEVSIILIGALVLIAIIYAVMDHIDLF